MSSVICLKAWPHLLHHTGTSRRFQPSRCSWCPVSLQTSPEPWAPLPSRSLSSSLQASGCHFLWVKEIQTDLGRALCRGGWHRVQVGEVIFNWLYLQFHSLVPAPAPPVTLSPRRGPSCTMELCRPCSPCSSCAIVVWAAGYFLLGAKDYSVIRNVCLSGRLRNKDYK